MRALSLAVFIRTVYKASTATSTPSRYIAKMSLQSTDLQVGTGDAVRPGATVSVHYTLTLNGFEDQNGNVVDSSRSRGRPFK